MFFTKNQMHVEESPKGFSLHHPTQSKRGHRPSLAPQSLGNVGAEWQRQDGTFFQSPHACIAGSQSTEPDPRTELKDVEGEFAAERKDLK